MAQTVVQSGSPLAVKWYGGTTTAPRTREKSMPEAFEKAREAGAKIRTIKLTGGKYAHVAIRPGGKKGPRGGRTIMGEIKKKKSHEMGLNDA